MIACRPEPEASAETEDAALWYEGQRAGLGPEFLQGGTTADDTCLKTPRSKSGDNVGTGADSD